MIIYNMPPQLPSVAELMENSSPGRKPTLSSSSSLQSPQSFHQLQVVRVSSIPSIDDIKFNPPVRRLTEPLIQTPYSHAGRHVSVSGPVPPQHYHLQPAPPGPPVMQNPPPLVSVAAPPQQPMVLPPNVALPPHLVMVPRYQFDAQPVYYSVYDYYNPYVNVYGMKQHAGVNQVPVYYPPPPPAPPSQKFESNNALINKRRIIKRRTRTGCLTCRKRRIKCDERKPHCFNCERSKKLCLGYEKLSNKFGPSE